MPELDELKIRLCSLQKSPIYAKADAAEKALACAVQVMDAQAGAIKVLWAVITGMDLRITTLEKGAGDGGKE